MASHFIKQDEGSHQFRYVVKENDHGRSGVERTVTMMASGVVNGHDRMADVSIELYISLLIEGLILKNAADFPSF